MSTPDLLCLQRSGQCGLLLGRVQQSLRSGSVGSRPAALHNGEASCLPEPLTQPNPSSGARIPRISSLGLQGSVPCGPGGTELAPAFPDKQLDGPTPPSCPALPGGPGRARRRLPPLLPPLGSADLRARARGGAGGDAAPGVRGHVCAPPPAGLPRSRRGEDCGPGRGAGADEPRAGVRLGRGSVRAAEPESWVPCSRLGCRLAGSPACDAGARAGKLWARALPALQLA